jgi:hypothetical protein
MSCGIDRSLRSDLGGFGGASSEVELLGLKPASIAMLLFLEPRAGDGSAATGNDFARKRGTKSGYAVAMLAFVIRDPGGDVFWRVQTLLLGESVA